MKYVGSTLFAQVLTLKKELNWFNRISKIRIQGMLVRVGIISMKIFVLKYLFG